MTDRPPLVIRVDADHGIGLGHAVRCAGLAGALGDRATICVAGAGDVLPGLFPGLEVIPAASDEAFAAALARLRPAGVLIDHPRRNGALSRLARTAAPQALVAVIDDEGGDLDADLVINGTVLEDYHRYTGLPPGARVLSGPVYTLLRPAFGRTPWAPQAAAGVVAVAGSGDRAADWAFFLASGALDRSGWGGLRLVVGAAFPARAALAAACAGAGIALHCGLGAGELAAALASAKLALITGGMIVYEALAVGVPAVVYPQIPNLIPEARWLAARGCIVDLGYDGGETAAAVTTAVRDLAGNPAAAAAMSARQRALIDGRGIERAAAVLATGLTRR